MTRRTLLQTLLVSPLAALIGVSRSPVVFQPHYYSVSVPISLEAILSQAHVGKGNPWTLMALLNARSGGPSCA